MTNSTRLSDDEASLALRALALPGLIRLVAEIDDNGPVDKGMLQPTVADLSRHQLRYAIEAGRDRGLLRTGEEGRPCYLLTDSGTELADLYDTAARWARRHQFPASAADFVTRVRDTLKLLSQLSGAANTGREAAARAGRLVEAGLVPHTDAAFTLLHLRGVLTAWIQQNPQVLGATAPCPTAPAGEVERAA